MIRHAVLSLTIAVSVGACGSQAPTGPGPLPPIAAECSRFTPSASSPYVLPFAPGQSSVVTRTLEHGAPQTFAIDFLRPMGSDVVAARSGLVIEAESGWADTDHAFGHENHVFIAHDDGTVARYFHLTQGGAVARVGQRVGQGEPIGRSGNSGNSTAPHLHFDVVESACRAPWPEGPYSDACHNTVPVSFRNTRAQACGIVSGETYTALPR